MRGTSIFAGFFLVLCSLSADVQEVSTIGLEKLQEMGVSLSVTSWSGPSVTEYLIMISVDLTTSNICRIYLKTMINGEEMSTAFAVDSSNKNRTTTTIRINEMLVDSVTLEFAEEIHPEIVSENRYEIALREILALRKSL